VLIVTFLLNLVEVPVVLDHVLDHRGSFLLLPTCFRAPEAIFVNVMGLISDRRWLLAEGSESALGQYVPCGLIRLVCALFAAGKVEVAERLESRLSARRRALIPAEAAVFPR
jgi:hypothetical protein